MEENMGQQPWLRPGTPWAENAWEIIWGSILVQNTNWKNVEPSLNNLKDATDGTFHPEKLLELSQESVIDLIRPSGFYQRKSQTLLAMARGLSTHHNDLDQLRSLDKGTLRKELLAIKGIGFETADYIMMYVLDQPAFMVDKYARRLFEMLGAQMPVKYSDFQRLVEQHVDLDLDGFREFHALIVEFGKVVKNPVDFADSFLANQKLLI